MAAWPSPRRWRRRCGPGSTTQRELSALVAEARGSLIGLAHYRPFARPLSASTGGFLDDLFVDPGSRGSGAAEALLSELGRVAAARG